jgi:transcription elongation factor Elf1
VSTFQSLIFPGHGRINWSASDVHPKLTGQKRPLCRLEHTTGFLNNPKKGSVQSWRIMGDYSQPEKDEIIKGYFGPAEDRENPRCPDCGEVFQFESNCDSGTGLLKIEVSCPDCGGRFSWQQPRLTQPWQPLHLQYFLERQRMGQSIRCPFDDCYVTYAEFSDSVLEFRCPYCNHRGIVELLRDSRE